jgi:hypothetical protein
MRNGIRTLYIIPVLLMVLMAACSAPEDSDSTNNNAAPQNGPQTTTVNTAPMTPEPQPTASLPPASAEPTNGKAPAFQPASIKEPKLVVPKTVIEFGNQAKEKTLSRSFVIKNEGTAELKIAAVEPS